ncbi:MAG: ArsB/NhaD family transporter [Armatimonadota bacterium]
MTAAAWIATGIFVAVYALLILDKLPKATLVLAGASLMIVLGVLDQHTAFHGTDTVQGVDWNTIFLLIGMMIVVNITRKTGLFDWIAIRTAKFGKGNPVLILIGMSVSTAVLSALIDNVTTVLLVVPTAIVIYEALELDPVPYLIFLVFASNIGGSATLIGHPANIIIGSATGFSFMDFIYVNFPIAFIIFVLLCAIAWFLFRSAMAITPEQKARIMQLDETRALRDMKLLWRSLAVIGLVFLGFGVHDLLGLEPATVALTGATLLLLLDPAGPTKTLEEVEWPTIFFFIGLFIMVAGLAETGVIEKLGMWMVDVTGGGYFALTMTVVWLAGIASALMGSIPFVATMSPIVRTIAQLLHPSLGIEQAVRHASMRPIWWALSLGSGIGQNFALIGAPTNLVAAAIAARSGHPISFKRFIIWGVPITFPFIVLCAVYLWLRFFTG